MIRKATKEDAACIAEMASMMWDGHLEELVEEFGAVLNNEESAIYLYCTDNIPIGFADCGMTMWRGQKAVRLDIWREFLFRKITGERDMQRTW